MRHAITRDLVVPVYALAILQECYCRPPQGCYPWHEINNAIADRWSWAAVMYIKARAWRMADALAKDGPAA